MYDVTWVLSVSKLTCFKTRKLFIQNNNEISITIVHKFCNSVIKIIIFIKLNSFINIIKNSV